MSEKGQNATKKQGNEPQKYSRGKNPNSLKNLENNKWEKGESGNPAGMEAGTKHRSTILKEILNTQSNFKNPIEGKVEKMEVEKAIDLAIVGKALKGDVSAYREIKDTVYGKIPDKNELTGKNGDDLFKRITVNVIRSNKKTDNGTND